jgi:hypothetical protein
MEAGNGNVTIVNDESSSPFAALQHNMFAQAIITVLVICVCTRVLSSHWFTSVRYGKGHNVTPPTLPYWIPGVKHAFSMTYDSKKFMAKCL